MTGAQSKARHALGGRVEHVGSLVWPEPLVRAWRQHELGDIEAPALRRAQNQAVRGVLAEQDRHGLPVVTDGELRRRSIDDSTICPGQRPRSGGASLVATVFYRVRRR